MDSFPLYFYTRGRVVFSNGSRALLPVGGGACRWIWRMRCADMGPALAGGAGAQGGVCGPPRGCERSRGPFSAGLAPHPRPLPALRALTPSLAAHTGGTSAPGEKRQGWTLVSLQEALLYYPDNELKTPLVVGPPGTLRLGLHPQPVLC